MARGKKDSEESSNSSESVQSSEAESDSIRSRSKERKREKKAKKKSKKASKDRKKKSKKSHHRSCSRSKSREKKSKKRKDSRDSRDSRKAKKRGSRSRSRSPLSLKRRHSSRASPPPRRRSRSHDRSRSRRSPPRRSPLRRRSPPRERYRSRSSRSRERDRRISTTSSRSHQSDYSRKRSPVSRPIKTFAPKCDLSALKILPGGSTYKPEMNEDQQIQEQLNNFVSKIEVENESSRKRKPTFQVSDFFGQESDEEVAKPTARSSRLTSLNGLDEVFCNSNDGDAKWKAVVPPATQVGPPKLTRAPKIENNNEPVPAPVAQMPHLIPMPGMDVKEEDVFIDENSQKYQVKTENADPDVLSDGMVISDSDEYDEEERNFINNSTYSVETDQTPVKREPPPLKSRPPPPLSRRKSHFSNDHFCPDSSPPDLSGPPKLAAAPGVLEDSFPPPENGPPKLEPAPKVLSAQEFNAYQSPPRSLKQEKIDEANKRLRPPPIPKFTLLKEPQYHCNKDFVRAGKDTRDLDCECRLPKDRREICCGEECLNRALMVECSNRCRTGDRCTNKNFQRRKYAPTEVFWAEGKGHGLKATAFIPRGTFIIEYLGEVVSAKEFKKRSHEYARNGKKHHYFMELSRQATIDAYQKGAVSRFINHSCEPNAETQKWTVNGLLRIGFFAIRDIHPGEEITFDYQFIHFGQGQKCLCGAPSCRGIIGREADRIPAPRKAGDKEEDENYGKLILNTRRVDCSEDMEKLARNMSRTSSREIKAKLKALDLILNSSKKLQSVFMTNFGLEILWSYAKEVHLDDNALKHDLLRLLGDLEISHRDKVEDNGLIEIIDKWSKIEDKYQEKSLSIVTKWKRLTRRVPLKREATPPAEPEREPTPPPMPTLTRRDSIRRRSPRLAKEPSPEAERSPEMDPETWRKIKEDRRRQFEENVRRRDEQEAHFREIAKQNVDQMVLDAMNESDNENDEFHNHLDPRTPTDSAVLPNEMENSIENIEDFIPDSPQGNPYNDPAHWEADEQRDYIKRIMQDLKPSEDDEIICDGAGCVVSRDDQGGLMVYIRAEDVEDFKQTWRDGKKYQEKKERAKKEKKDADAAELERKIAQSMETTVAPADTTVANGDAVPDEMLPDGWKSHKDDEGSTYYYHDKTRETSWDPPQMGKEEYETKIGKLRRMLCKFIAEVLLAYRDESTTHGRITSEADYKYLIRRLSHGLSKRITTELNTFRLTEEGKMMAAKYSHKYMTRQGECFIRRPSTQKPPSAPTSTVS